MDAGRALLRGCPAGRENDARHRFFALSFIYTISVNARHGDRNLSIRKGGNKNTAELGKKSEGRKRLMRLRSIFSIV